MSEKQAAAIPVVGFSFDIKFTDRPGGDNVVVQYHLPIDLALDEMKTYTGKVMEVVSHEKLKYRHRELLREKQISETFIARSKEDLQTKHAHLSEVEERALQVHTEQGRKGPIKYTGATGIERDRVKQEIMSARQVVDTAETRHKHLLLELELTEEKLGVNSTGDSS